jgi:hypothetical protein
MHGFSASVHSVAAGKTQPAQSRDCSSANEGECLERFPINPTRKQTMCLEKKLSGALCGLALALSGSFSQAAVITAAADFDLSTLVISSTGGISSISALSYDAYAETPNLADDQADSAPVFSAIDDVYASGSASVFADAAAIDPDYLSVSATVFDDGYALGVAGYEVMYEVLDDGDITISVDYSAFYDLDGSSTASALVLLGLDDSLSGAADAIGLYPGDPMFAAGTLSVDFFALAGEVGSVYLFSAAGVEVGAVAVPVPGGLLLVSIGLIGLVSARTGAARISRIS